MKTKYTFSSKAIEFYSNLSFSKKLPARIEIMNPYPVVLAEFIYKLVDMCDGPKKFYRDFYLTAVCPLGFTRDGRNYNYYDSPTLLNCVEPFIVDSTNKQLAFGAHRASSIHNAVS